jgi:23S rRNA pseudouridine1911/1915/1917 synthase
MRQFQYRTVEKTYIGLTERAPKTATGRIEAPIGRDPSQRRKMMVSRDGKPAISEFFVIEQFKTGQSLIRVKLLTGRTHQIRVHMAFVNAPLVGDSLYGARKKRIKLHRQFLHAAKLCFDQPTTGERLCFESPLPDELEQVLETLRR